MESFEEMAAYVKEHAAENDLVLTMGAGDIDRQVSEITQKLTYKLL